MIVMATAAGRQGRDCGICGVLSMGLIQAVMDLTITGMRARSSCCAAEGRALGVSRPQAPTHLQPLIVMCQHTRPELCTTAPHIRHRRAAGPGRTAGRPHHHITSHHITSHHITSHHITSHHITSHHIASHRIASHHITSHHITSHHITSHRITSHHISTHLSA